MKMLLKSIVDLKSGLMLRKRPDYTDRGEFLYIQLKDILENQVVDWDNLQRINVNNPKKVNLVRRGDILFRAKGFQHDALYIDEQIDNVLVSAQFFILRTKSQIADPQYIAWYINQPTAQEYFNTVSAGTYVPSINRKNLLELEVELPDMAKQKLIADIYRLRRREQSLVRKLDDAKDSLINTVLLNVLTNKQE